MRLHSLMLAMGLPIAVWGADVPAPVEVPSQDQGVVIRVGDHETKALTLEDGRGEEDVKDFESFLLVNMARRGVCLDKLGSAFYERLHGVLMKTAEENPTRFHYFLLASPQFDEKQIADVFVVLRDAPDSFSRYVEAQVRFLKPQTSAASVPGDAATGAQNDQPAVREEQIPEAAVREYKRYQMHCPVLWVSDDSSGEPLAQCRYQKFDLQAAFGRVMGDDFGGSGADMKPLSSAPPVSAIGPLRAEGPADTPSR
jgi:hypothetical protein